MTDRKGKLYEPVRSGKLIGVTGKMYAGKTSVSNWFVRNRSFEKLAFGDPLKKALVKLTGLDMSFYQCPIKKGTPIPGLDITPRKIMQLFGTEFARNIIKYDFWIWRLEQEVARYRNKDIIIDDVRFDNEAKFVRDNGGKIVHLTRDFDSDEIPLVMLRGDGYGIHADPVKEALVELTGLDMSYFLHPVKKTTQIKGLRYTPEDIEMLLHGKFIPMLPSHFSRWRLSQESTDRPDKELDMAGFDKGIANHKSEEGIRIMPGDFLVIAEDGIGLTALKVADLIM